MRATGGNTLLASLTLMAVLLISGATVTGRTLYVLTLGLIYAAISTSLDVFAGYAGKLVLSNFAFVAVGAYISAILASDVGVPITLTFLPAAGVAMVLALVLGLPIIRLPQLSTALVTFFFAFVIMTLLAGRILAPWTHSSNGIAVPAFGIFTTQPFALYLLAWGYLLLVVLVCVRYISSRSGRVLLLIKQDETIAEVMGINVRNAMLWSFVFTAGVAGAAGVIFAQAVGFLAPESFDPIKSVYLVEMIVLGGIGSIVGPIIGAVSFSLIDYSTRAAGAWREVITALIFLIFLVFFPGGIFRLLTSGWEKLTRLSSHKFPKSFAINTPEKKEASTDSRSSVVESDKTCLNTAFSRSVSDTLSIDDVQVRFGALAALNGISLVARSGEVHAVIGPNGAGKTTLLNCISGIQSIYSGRMLFGNQPLHNLSPHAVRRIGIARTFQHTALALDMTARENIRLGTFGSERQSLWRDLLPLSSTRTREKKSSQAADEALSLINMKADKANMLAGALTVGEQKLVDIARAVAGRPQLLIMDEPTAGLEGNQIDLVVNVIYKLKRELGIPILVIAHHVGFIREIADQTTVLDFGQVLANGAPEEVISRPEVIEAFLGQDYD